MGALTDLLREATQSDQKKFECECEIAGTKLNLFAYPLCGAELDQIARKHKKFMTEPTMRSIVDLIALKAYNADTGEKAFGKEDVPHLHRMPLTWLNDLREKLLPDDEVDLSEDAIEDAEKN